MRNFVLWLVPATAIALSFSDYAHVHAFQASAGRAGARTHAYGSDVSVCMQASRTAAPKVTLGRRALFPLVALPSLIAIPGAVAAAEQDEKSAKAARLAQAMAVVSFTKTVDQATEKAIKLAEKGDLVGAEKQWNIVVDTYESGDDGVVVSTQAVYRLGKTLSLRADVRSQLGQKNKNQKKLVQAIDDYTRSLTIVDQPESRIKLATVLLLVGRDAESEKQFDAVINSDVGNQVKGRAYNNRGLVKQQQGKWAEAVEDFQEAVSITQGGSPEALKNLALAKFEAGDEAGALTMLQNQAKAAFLGPIEVQNP